MSDLLPPAPLTVSELNALARELLEGSLNGLWVGGEVSNLTCASSGHFYFSLKDSRAQVRCVLFKHSAARLAAPLKEGGHIEVSGKISLYEARGEFQITVSEVRQIGLGQLYERYEALKRQLETEGLFAAARKRPLPAEPRCIGIVTSTAAAALRDVASTLKRRAPDVALIVYPTAVQGANSGQQIVQALRQAAEHAQADILIVCRGGGSIEDLWPFNEEAVVRAVAASPIPVISGVGHETDFTLTDFAADIRAPTPTAAAEMAAPDRTERIRRLAQSQTLLRTLLLQRYQNAAQQIDFLARRLRHPRQSTDDRQKTLAALSVRLHHSFRQILAVRKQHAAHLADMLAHSRPNIVEAGRRLAGFQAALPFARRRIVGQSRETLARQAALLEAVSPQNILNRGFAVVRDTRNRVVRDTAALKPGQKLHLLLAKGETDVQVAKAQNQQELFD